MIALRGRDIMYQAPVDLLWAKKPYNEDDIQGIVPLREHLYNVVNEITRLWDMWVSRGVKKTCQIEEDLARKLLIFLGYTHDLGKASPAFQLKESFKTPDCDDFIRQRIEQAGYKVGNLYPNRNNTPHALVSYDILKQAGLDESICVIVGGHHGKPPEKQSSLKKQGYLENCGYDCEKWKGAQQQLLAEACRIIEMPVEEIKNIKLPISAQVLFSGLLIYADWLASTEEDISLPTMWRTADLSNPYEMRFNIKFPRPVQKNLELIINEAKNPGIFIIEAPMGEGKTEAALVASELLAAKSGTRGIYFALPSQATSNAMFERVLNWLTTFDQDANIRLVHGKSHLNETYEALRYSMNTEDDTHITVHEWLSGRKKGILSDFNIGTIDHVLMAGLKQKHLAMRHLGLASKVLIIDECHAYDIYMQSYLLKTLSYLGAYGVPVIILSATLPTATRQKLIGAYLNQTVDGSEAWATSLAYPLITYTEGQKIMINEIPANKERRDLKIAVKLLEDRDVLSTLKEKIIDGGCVGLIFNTVRKAQNAYNIIAQEFGTEKVELLHSGFIAIDRATKEEQLVSVLGKANLGKRESKIVIGTQIFEQSLDIDFDMLFTELCPMDLLLQRIGRLHRHDRWRPDHLTLPTCYVIGAIDETNLDKGSAYIYGEDLLLSTLHALPSQIHLPNDIPRLIADVYEEYLLNPDDKQRSLAQKAESYQIVASDELITLLGWLENPIQNDVEGEARVRHGDDSLEVLVVQRKNETLHLLPWVNNGEELSVFTLPHYHAKAIASCSVRLPYAFSYLLGDTIDVLESEMQREGIVDSWYENYLLKGQLVMILDENLMINIGGKIMQYSKNTGLSLKEEAYAR